MGALANGGVGQYVNANFTSTYVKVGTFALVNGQKQGGNVASYFCLPDGRVLHAIAGPVDANTFLTEATWIVDAHRKALFEAPANPAAYLEAIRRAHVERAARDFTVHRDALDRLYQRAQQMSAGPNGGTDRGTAAKLRVLSQYPRRIDKAGRIHIMLALFPLARVEEVYRYVFEDILNEKVTSLPVVEK